MRGQGVWGERSPCPRQTAFPRSVSWLGRGSLQLRGDRGDQVSRCRAQQEVLPPRAPRGLGGNGTRSRGWHWRPLLLPASPRAAGTLSDKKKKLHFSFMTLLISCLLLEAQGTVWLLGALGGNSRDRDKGDSYGGHSHSCRYPLGSAVAQVGLGQHRGDVALQPGLGPVWLCDLEDVTQCAEVQFSHLWNGAGACLFL